MFYLLAIQNIKKSVQIKNRTDYTLEDPFPSRAKLVQQESKNLPSLCSIIFLVQSGIVGFIVIKMAIYVSLFCLLLKIAWMQIVRECCFERTSSYTACLR